MWMSAACKVTCVAISATLAISAAVTGARAGEPIYVALDVAKVARLPPSATTLVIGNPTIADITMLKNAGSMVITGKSYGETNLIALDKNGELVAESAIRVRPSGAHVLVQRGGERESYSCAPDCMLAPQLGDGKAFEAMNTQVQQRNATLSGAAQAQTPGR